MHLAADLLRCVERIARVREEMEFGGADQHQAVRTAVIGEVTDVSRGGNQERVDLMFGQPGGDGPATLVNFSQPYSLAACPQPAGWDLPHNPLNSASINRAYGPGSFLRHDERRGYARLRAVPQHPGPVRLPEGFPRVRQSRRTPVPDRASGGRTVDEADRLHSA